MAVSQAERREVEVWKARLDAFDKVWKRRKPRSVQLQKMLAGRYVPLLPQSAARLSAVKTGKELDPDDEQIDTNLFLRTTTTIKAKIGPGEWEPRYLDEGDLDDADSAKVSTFAKKVLIQARAPEELVDGVDDVCTIGPIITFVGTDRSIVNRDRLAGQRMSPDELVAKAMDGMPVSPLPGMDFSLISDMVDDILKKKLDDGTPNELLAQLPLENQDNLRRLANEAGKMHAEELDLPPKEWSYGDVWVERLPAGDRVAWDTKVSHPRDIRWFARLLMLTRKECDNEETWKASARKELKVAPIPADSGAEPITSTTLDSDTVTELNGFVMVWEIWDKDGNALHYIAKSGGYDGYLERDSTYPHTDAQGKSIFGKWWFPVIFAPFVTHNMQVADRTWGNPVLEAGLPHQVAFTRFYSALTASRARAARVVWIPEGLSEDQIESIRSGKDCTILEINAGLIKDGKPPFFVMNYGEASVDLTAGMMKALELYAGSVDMSVPDISGLSIAPTATQENQAAAGAELRSNGLIRKFQAYAGDVAMAVLALVRVRYNKQKVTAIMGPDFTSQVPATDQNNQPIIDPATGKQGMLPSVWDRYLASSLTGDKVQVRFGVLAHMDDAAEQKQDMDLAAVIGSQVSPITKMPRFDNKAMIEQMAKKRGYGKLPDYKPTPLEQQILMAQVAPPAPDGDGADGEGEDDREAPGGGREDGRAAHGERGPGAAPHRQDRHETAMSGPANGNARRAGVA